jgi:hypothetical protein
MAFMDELAGAASPRCCDGASSQDGSQCSAAVRATSSPRPGHTVRIPRWRRRATSASAPAEGARSRSARLPAQSATAQDPTAGATHSRSRGRRSRCPRSPLDHESDTELRRFRGQPMRGNPERFRSARAVRRLPSFLTTTALGSPASSWCSSTLDLFRRSPAARRASSRQQVPA